MRAVFIPMIEFEKLEKVIEHAELTVTHFRSLVNSMDDETYDKFDGTPIGANSAAAGTFTTLTANTAVVPDSAGGADLGATSGFGGQFYNLGSGYSSPTGTVALNTATWSGSLDALSINKII